MKKKLNVFSSKSAIVNTCTLTLKVNNLRRNLHQMLCRSTVLLVKCRPFVDGVSVKCRPSVGVVLVKWQPIDGQQSADSAVSGVRYGADC